MVDIGVFARHGQEYSCPAMEQLILSETAMASGVSRTEEFLRIKPTRLGADAADTYANSIGIIGVQVRRVE